MAEIFFGEPEGVNVGDIYASRKALIKPTKSEPKWFAIGVDPPLSINAQKLSVTSKLSQLLLEKQIGDKIDLGNGFEIQEIKKYKS